MSKVFSGQQNKNVFYSSTIKILLREQKCQQIIIASIQKILTCSIA